MRAILLSLMFAWSAPALAAGKSGPCDSARTSPKAAKQCKARQAKQRKQRKRKKGMKIDDVSPVHGVLIYGPKLETHDKYKRLTKGKKSAVVAKKDLPKRDVDRDGSIAVGVTAGSLMQGFADGSGGGQMGLGIQGRYRPTEYLGLELGLQRYSDELIKGTDPSMLTSASVDLFAFPWSQLSPYAQAGVTILGQPSVESADPLTGAHVGIGLEFSPSKSLALDLGAKSVHWLGLDPTDTRNPSALQIGGAVMFHF